MCIICYKPENVATPPKDVLETCYYNNPDGAGYAIWCNGDNYITYKKGFFSFASLYDSLMNEVITEKDRLAVHFRIATHGSIEAKNCHPFCVHDNTDIASSTEGYCKSVLLHNGILSAPYSSNKKVSDTLAFTLSLAKKERELIESGSLKDFIEKETRGNRILYMNAADDIIIKSGSWLYDKETGCFFSNGTYEDYYYTYKGYNWYNDDAPFLPICPYCGGYVKQLSVVNDLFECEQCCALCDSEGNELELYIVERKNAALYKGKNGSHDV